MTPVIKSPAKNAALLACLVALISVALFAIAIGTIYSFQRNTNLKPTTSPKLSTPTYTLIIGTTITSDIDGMMLVYVPEGEFLMGSSDADVDANPDEKPRHKVYIDAFWIDRTEITWGMYEKCVTAKQCTPPGDILGDDNIGDDTFPVKNVNWDQAAAYCTWARRHLLTEAEWEKAARGTDGRIYPWGNQAPNDELGNIIAHEGYTTAVGIFPAGASPYGALDMAGNVWEWVQDWYGETYYTDSPYRNPTGPTSGIGRVMRGGIHSPVWRTGNVPSARAAFRDWNLPNKNVDSYGIRCMLNVSEVSIEKTKH
jgi:eukaryotic-like serine/threonine-protein kinase